MDEILEIFVERDPQKFQEFHPFFLYPNPNPNRNAAQGYICGHQ